MRKEESEAAKNDRRTWRLVVVLTLTASYFVVEIAVGYYTNSVALVADSFHMLSDVIALIVGLVAVHFAQRPSSKYYTFGYRRAEVLGCLINGVFLMALCFSIAIEALERFMDPQMITDPVLLLTVGSIGLGVNLLSVIIMFKYSDVRLPSFSHSQGEQDVREEAEALNHTQRGVERQHSIKAVFLHVLCDALGSVGVIVSAVIAWKVDAHWTPYVDPTISLLIVMMLIICTIPLLREVTRILLESAPKNMNVESLKNEILQIDGVKAVRDLHIWELQSNLVIASVHIRLASMDTYEHAALQIKQVFRTHNVYNTTIQPEFENEERSSSPITHGKDEEHAPPGSTDAEQCCSHRIPSTQYGSQALND